MKNTLWSVYSEETALQTMTDRRVHAVRRSDYGRTAIVLPLRPPAGSDSHIRACEERQVNNATDGPLLKPKNSGRILLIEAKDLDRAIEDRLKDPSRQGGNYRSSPHQRAYEHPGRAEEARVRFFRLPDTGVSIFRTRRTTTY